MALDDPYLVQLRRELTKAQARLLRAERQRDQLAEENHRLRELLTAAGLAVPPPLAEP